MGQVLSSRRRHDAEMALKGGDGEGRPGDSENVGGGVDCGEIR